MNNRVILFSAGEIGDVASALSSQLRRRMVELLFDRKLNINQIAETLGIPQSTAATNVLLLEKAGLVSTRQIAGKKGAQKICTLAADEIVLRLVPEDTDATGDVIETQMPVGLFTDFSASTPCGLLSSAGVIGYYDNIDSFLNPHRATAQLIWFSKGYLEYRFPKNIPAGARINSLSITAELCSEFPGSNPDWPSDLTVWVNGIEIGTWICPGDMGDRRGALTPDWWGVGDTQYGFLKTWRVANDCSYIDGTKTSDVRFTDLAIDQSSHITVRIGVKDDAENCGGMNLFGRGFGNYEKDVVLQLGIEH